MDSRQRALLDANPTRYKVDRLREHSAILEPHEQIDPYRPLARADQRRGNPRVERRWSTSPTAKSSRLGWAGCSRSSPKGPKAALRTAEVLKTALDVAFRLGEPFARGPVRPGPAGGRSAATAARRDRRNCWRGRSTWRRTSTSPATSARSSPASTSCWLRRADGVASDLEPLLGQCFRGLRKLGMRDEIGRLLDRMAEADPEERGVARTAPSPAAAPRRGPVPRPIAWSRRCGCSSTSPPAGSTSASTTGPGRCSTRPAPC